MPVPFWVSASTLSANLKMISRVLFSLFNRLFKKLFGETVNSFALIFGLNMRSIVLYFESDFSASFSIRVALAASIPVNPAKVFQFSSSPNLIWSFSFNCSKVSVEPIENSIVRGFFRSSVESSPALYLIAKGSLGLSLELISGFVVPVPATSGAKL